jgi:hypothetical protein
VRACPRVARNTRQLTKVHSDGQRCSGTQLFVQVIRACAFYSVHEIAADCGGHATGHWLRVFGPKKDEVTGQWRRLRNEELYDLYSVKYYPDDQIKNRDR